MTRILFVCTANICRSPYAAAALRQTLGADARFDIVSAGVRADWLEVAGEAACDEMPYGVVRPSGLVVTHDAPHESSQLTVDMVREADLIVTFEQSHRAAVLDLLPRAQTKVYTARQILRLATAVSAPIWPPAAPERTGEPLRDLNAARSWAPYEDDSDVADPHGNGIQAHHACADEVDSVVSAMVSVLLPTSV